MADFDKLPRLAATRRMRPGEKQRLKEAIALFCEEHVHKLPGLLARIEVENGPRAAFECITDLLEYAVPKLARQEHTDGDGKPLQLTVRWAEPDAVVIGHTEIIQLPPKGEQN